MVTRRFGNSFGHDGECRRLLEVVARNVVIGSSDYETQDHGERERWCSPGRVKSSHQDKQAASGGDRENQDSYPYSKSRINTVSPGIK